ncbi:aprataxin and PNK-like factor [Protopterus annectens]|uniref:aprataxin and PNK-like factor n=1 Tax=Protopterus annectens TaxID=7888 RepID=UPI001CFB160C|nr:aprataxin and PNK-like factor [Protopterus annectens]
MIFDSVFCAVSVMKNPNHFKEFSHPGDEDYNQSAQDVNVSDSDDDRPECPYGTACYRKNPQHKIEYKHTENPVPEAKRKRPKQRAANKGKSVLDGDSDDDGEPNDYDLNDSFIDDEISEEEEEEFDQSDEDSDWEPESEEVDVLVKEATQFVKSKR